MGTKTRQRAAKILLALALRLAGTSVHAQENRKALNNPTPTYPETARQFRLTGVVKVQIVIAPDGQIKDVKDLALKNWKYAPAGSETTATPAFNFHP